MITTTTFWLIVSVILQVLIAAVAFLLPRVVRLAIRNEILQLKNELSDKYATKDELNEKVDLVNRVESGFAGVRQQIRGLSGGN